MSLSSRGARAAAHSLRRPYQACQPHRQASHGADHGHSPSESALHADPGIKVGGESLGKSFYISLALIPLSYLTYITVQDDKNPIQRFVDNYTLRSEIESEKNALHARGMDQARSDRHLFKDSVMNFAGPPHRYLEHLNHSTMINTVAGQGAGNMDQLMEYYAEEKRKRTEESENGGKRILEEKRV